jgi:hypothetical protein
MLGSLMAISAEQAKRRAAIIRFCNKWERRLDLPGVDVTWSFIEDYHHQDIVGEEDAWISADTIVDEPYRQATIRFYLPACQRLALKDLEHIVLHEYGHIILARLEACCKPNRETTNATENAVENLTLALLKTDRMTRSKR